MLKVEKMKLEFPNLKGKSFEGKAFRLLPQRQRNFQNYLLKLTKKK